MKYVVIATKNEQEVGRWVMNNEDRANDLKIDKEKEGYIVRIEPQA